MKSEFVIPMVILLANIAIILIINMIVNKLLQNKITNKSDIESSITINLTKLSLFISVSLLISEINSSIYSLLKIIPHNTDIKTVVFQTASFFSIFIIIVILSFFLLLLISYLLFKTIFIGKDIIIEIVNGNIGILLFFIGVLLALVLAFKANLPIIFDYFINYPTIYVN
jgi:hypothetical protein